jgi:hypothetical protein
MFVVQKPGNALIAGRDVRTYSASFGVYAHIHRHCEDMKRGPKTGQKKLGDLGYLS